MYAFMVRLAEMMGVGFLGASHTVWMNARLLPWLTHQRRGFDL